MSQILSVPVSQIQGAGLQVRCETNRAHVDDLAELMADGWPHELPPVVVFYDGGAYHLADGHHRWQAAREAGVELIPCEVHSGDKIAALWFAIGANAQHGLRRTNEDKRRAVLLAYQLDPALSDNAIAKRCHVSPDMANYTLRSLRSQNRLSESDSQPETPSTMTGPAPDIRTDARGRKMDVSRIGKSKPAPAAEGGPAIPAAAEMEDAIRLLREAQHRIGAAAKLPGGELLRSHYLKLEKHGDTERLYAPDIQNAIRELRHRKPHAACPSCRETVKPGCNLCLGAGWINESTWDRLPDRLKAA